MTSKKEFNVLSPDEIPISMDNFSSEKKAKEYYSQWVKRYEGQGYYSSNNGRIELDELKDNCLLITIINNKVTQQPL